MELTTYHLRVNIELTPDITYKYIWNLHHISLRVYCTVYCIVYTVYGTYTTYLGLMRAPPQFTPPDWPVV